MLRDDMTQTRLPLIGLTVGPDEEGSEELTFRLAYARAIEAAGGAPVLIPPCGASVLSSILERLDGIVLPGGADIDPVEYGAAPHPTTHANRDLDRLELGVARWAVDANVPVLGICRGQQVINVAQGGTLLQHLDPHQHPIGKTASHLLRIQPESRLAEILSGTEVDVNTRHHQAIEKLGGGLAAVAWAPDGTIEGIESADHTGNWLVAVQFHPEDLISTHEPSRKLFAAFVAACRQARR
jgi:gamma-glutamyl-gamma-aminobutyrate hydrolase PuuD